MRLRRWCAGDYGEERDGVRDAGDGGGGKDDGVQDLWTVDSTYLESAARELDALHSFLLDKFMPGFKDINDRMGTQDHNPFGGKKVADAMALWQKHDQHLTAARQTYTSIAKQIQDAADATRKIAANYKTLEERNHTTMQNIEQAFNDHGGSSPRGTGTSPGSGAPSGGSDKKEFN
jgi:hypothetical protein